MDLDSTQALRKANLRAILKYAALDPELREIIREEASLL